MTDREMLEKLREFLTYEQHITPQMVDAEDQSEHRLALQRQIGEAWEMVRDHLTAQEPKPYVCTVVLEMPADVDGTFVPSDLVEFLTDHGGQLIEGHDQDMIGGVERSNA